MAESGKPTTVDVMKDAAFRRSHQQGVVRGHITRVRTLMMADRFSDVQHCEDQLVKLIASREEYVCLQVALLQLCTTNNVDTKDVEEKARLLYKDVQSMYDEAQDWIVAMRTCAAEGGLDVSDNDSVVSQADTTVMQAGGSDLQESFFTPGRVEPSRIFTDDQVLVSRQDLMDHNDYETALKEKESEMDELSRKVAEMSMKMDSLQTSQHRAKVLEEQMKRQNADYESRFRAQQTENHRLQADLNQSRDHERAARTSTPTLPHQRPQRAPDAGNRTTFDQEDIFAISQVISSTNADMMRQMLDHGDRQRESFYSSMNVPVTPLQRFDGDPTKYLTFMRRFDEVVHSSRKNTASKLNTLIEHCEDSVRAHLDCCNYKSAECGYTLARNILKQKYGNPYTVSQAWVEKLMTYPHLHTADLIGRFVGELSSAYETLDTLGFLSELECTRSMRMLVSKLPLYVQNRWRRIHREHFERGEQARLRQLIGVIREASQEMSDPVYGPESLTKVPVPDVRQKVGAGKKKASINVGEVSQRPVRGTGGSSGVPFVRVARFPCHLCKEPKHYTYQCYEFKDYTPAERLSYVDRNRLCYLCLNESHQVADCDRTYTCQYPGCRMRHNTTLHRALEARRREKRETPVESTNIMMIEDDGDAGENVTDEEDSVDDVRMNDDPEGLPVLFHETTPVYNGSRYFGNYMLPTLPVRCDTVFKGTTSNAIIDTGSTVTMCSEDFRRAIGAKAIATSEFILQGINDERIITADVIEFSIRGVGSSDSHDVLNVIVNPHMNFSQKHAAHLQKYREWPHLRHLDIPPAEHDTAELLLGQDNAHLFKSSEYIEGRDLYSPYGVHTPLGWTIFGNLTEKLRRYRVSCEVTEASGIRSPMMVDDLLEHMWEVEHVPEVEPMSPVNRAIVVKWKDEFQMIDGHIQLPLPFKCEPPNFPDNRGPVLSQLNALKKKFEKNPELHVKYCASMQTNIDRGFTEKVTEPPVPGYENFVPQHAVISDRRPGKCRIVGNASFVYRNCSLNASLHQGPNLTGDLVEIMIDFRVHPVVLTADIEQMYNQVRVPPEQRDALKLLWWPEGDMSREPEEYRMTTQMFGLISSPAAAMYAMKEGVRRYGDDMSPETVQAALRNFYVDDLIKSIVSVAVGIRLARELKELLSRIGFNLTKFGSNRLEVLEAIDQGDRDKPFKELEFALTEDNTAKTLGSGWGPLRDVFIFVISIIDRPNTRRGVLSTFSSVYDPLGLVGPVILRAKMIIQGICRRGSDWDEDLDDESLGRWLSWKEDLQRLSGFEVPRWLKAEAEREQTYTLHVFADASERGYGAVAYLSVMENHTAESTIVMSKAKVAPIKQMSIPCLELSAAVLAVKVARIIERSVSIPLQSTVFWSDSTITLHCILSQSRVFKTFVANRVAFIQEHTLSTQWRFISGPMNIADVVSRGCQSEELRDNDEWINGPAFLRSREEWPEMPDVLREENVSGEPEYRTPACPMYTMQGKEWLIDDRENLMQSLIDHYSTWRGLIKGVGYWKKFIGFLKNKKKFRPGFTADEYRDNADCVIRFAQRDFHHLKSRPALAFRRLYTFDDDDIIRVGGRIMMSCLEYEERYPAVLPPGRVAAMYVLHVHRRLGHPGVDRTYMETRKKVWIISGKRFVKAKLDKCVMCDRLRSKATEQLMAPLPHYRVNVSETPFEKVGVDFFGPIYVKLGRATVKRYGCAITCFASRAMHIEPVSNLTTEAFLQSLQRFIARRGKPKLIVSDNGTNFVGARRELIEMMKKWNKTIVNNYLAEEGIEWRFNTPTASHHGGVWERQIRSVRTLMMALVKNQSLTDETFHTYMCMVEQIINSRPLTKVSEDPGDELPLTPQHFLTLHRAGGIPGVYTPADSLRRGYKQIQYLSDQYWRRWSASYLKDLQVRTKWHVPYDNFKVGDLALYTKQDCCRLDWPLALITHVHPGLDGRVRSVTIKTRDGVYQRPITKLIRLEFDE